MNHDEQKARWDLKYEEGLPSLTEPDPFFIAAYQKFVEPHFQTAGLALDLAGGLGRHALWLASRNWKVTVVDISDVAIRKLSQAALDRTVELTLQVQDASEYQFESSRFDLIVLFYHFDRSIFPTLLSALKPDGLLICKMALNWSADAKTASGAPDPLRRDELPSLVPEMQVLYHHERPVRDRGVAELVGRKAKK